MRSVVYAAALLAIMPLVVVLAVAMDFIAALWELYGPEGSP